MRISMAKFDGADEVPAKQWATTLVGHPLDARGEAAVDFARRNSNRVITCEYDSNTFELIIDGERVQAEDITDVLRTHLAAPVLIEATTLGFPEILLYCKGLRSHETKSADFLYVEPARYRRRDSSGRGLLHRRDFELSNEIPGYRAIPTTSFVLDDRQQQKLVFFLGYEERRLDRALEDYPIQPRQCSVVFGVPAFRPGWEMDAFANNIAVLETRDVSGGVHFCGAENPLGAYETLVTIEGECDTDQRLFVAPIGTKPHGIGVALFAAVRPEVGILYDHPQRRPDRSHELGHWHLFSTDFQV